MKLGIVGLGFSHPISFARYFKESGGIEMAYVWDYSQEKGEPGLNRIEHFQSEFGAQKVDEPFEMIDGGVDGVLIEVKNGERLRHAGMGEEMAS